MLLVCLYVDPVSVTSLSTYDVENKCLHQAHHTRRVKHTSVWDGNWKQWVRNCPSGTYRESQFDVGLHYECIVYGVSSLRYAASRTTQNSGHITPCNSLFCCRI